MFIYFLVNVRFERIELSVCVEIAGHVAKCPKKMTRETA